MAHLNVQGRFQARVGRLASRLALSSYAVKTFVEKQLPLSLKRLKETFKCEDMSRYFYKVDGNTMRSFSILPRKGSQVCGAGLSAGVLASFPVRRWITVPDDSTLVQQGYVNTGPVVQHHDMYQQLLPMSQISLSDRLSDCLTDCFEE